MGPKTRASDAGKRARTYPHPTLGATPDGPTARARPARREPFSGGVWFKLTAGRNQRAEPRWLLPMICRMGDVTRNEVGAIEIADSETLFEISAAHAERFAAHVKAPQAQLYGQRTPIAEDAQLQSEPLHLQLSQRE